MALPDFFTPPTQRRDERIGKERQINNNLLDEKLLARASRIEKAIGVVFANKALLLQSFTHASYLNEHPEYPLGHNERLEFLGDAVLELVVTQYLFDNFIGSEGEMTAWRSCLVGGKHLIEISLQLGLEFFILSNNKALRDEENKRTTVKAMTNVVEALIGALYIDQGAAATEQFILEYFCSRLPRLIEDQRHIDPKGKLQEICQTKGVRLQYITVDESGPANERRYIVAVFVGGHELGRGKGPSIKKAGTAAAQGALRVLNKGDT